MAFFGKHVRLVCVAPGQISEPFYHLRLCTLRAIFHGPSSVEGLNPLLLV